MRGETRTKCYLFAMVKGDLTVRRTRTASGATAVQVVRYESSRCVVVKHMGSAHEKRELEQLMYRAEQYAEAHRAQPSLFAEDVIPPVDMASASLVEVTHRFARRVLMACARHCGLGDLPELYLDLALMRIIEPSSKLRALELLERYFDVTYAERTLYRLLPKLIAHQMQIEQAAIDLARHELKDTLSLVLYDVTTLYFESFKAYDLQRPGFSKDNKPQQPQIVIGLITTRSGMPLMHEVFEGNTFEGHTMLGILRRLEQRIGTDCKPVIVADAAMLSRDNMQKLEEQGYRYIVGARLANTTRQFIEQISTSLPRTDQSIQRFQYAYAKQPVSIVCEFSATRYKKDKREFDKQVIRAQSLLERNEPGRRAKFVKKSDSKGLFEFNTDLKLKTEKLLGIKGYVTNIPQEEMSNAAIVAYYRDLWHVEQAFRMSKSDLQARPIYHHTADAIRSHVMLCFMALMIGKYLEIHTGKSLRKVRDELWQIHEAHIRDERTGLIHVLTMKPQSSMTEQLIDHFKLENTY